MWQRSGARLFAFVVLSIVVAQAAAMATLVTAFLLEAAGHLPHEAIRGALGIAGGVVLLSVIVLAAYILAFHVLASAREKLRQERVRGWGVWWRGLLQYTRADYEGTLPREALDAFLDLRESLPAAESERLAGLADRYDIAERLSERVGARNERRRLEALQDLARARLGAALPTIVTALRDPSPRVRRHALRAAARTLARMPAEERDAPGFVRAMRSIDLPPPLVAESLLLLESAAAEVVPLLLAAPDLPRAVLRAALITAGRRDLGGLALAVLPFVDDEEAEVRAAALRALAGMGRLPPGGAARVAARVTDEESFVRGHAVRAAAHLPAAHALELLWARLGDPSWWVRLAAAKAMVGLGASGRLSLERASASHPDRYARDMAQQALLDAQWKGAA